MSSNKITVNGNELDISGVDVHFVFECLRNLDSDRQINLTQVAESMGYSNVASVGNRLRSLKKRYGFDNLEGRTAAAAAKAAATATANREMSTNTVKTETEKTTAAAAAPKKKGRPARAKTAEVNGTAAPVEDLTNGHANGTTANGTANGEERKPSAKRKRDDEGNEEGASAGQKQPKPAKRARSRRQGTAGAQEVAAGEAKGGRKAAPPRPTEIDPPLDMEELTETVCRMENPADRMLLLAVETVKEARRERRLRQQTPKTGLKLRFRKTAA